MRASQSAKVHSSILLIHKLVNIKMTTEKNSQTPLLGSPLGTVRGRSIDPIPE